MSSWVFWSHLVKLRWDMVVALGCGCPQVEMIVTLWWAKVGGVGGLGRKRERGVGGEGEWIYTTAGSGSAVVGSDPVWCLRVLVANRENCLPELMATYLIAFHFIWWPLDCMKSSIEACWSGVIGPVAMMYAWKRSSRMSSHLGILADCRVRSPRWSDFCGRCVDVVVLGEEKKNLRATRGNGGGLLWRLSCKPLGETRRSNFASEWAPNRSIALGLPEYIPRSDVMAFAAHGLDDRVLDLLAQGGLEFIVHGDHQIDIGLLIPTNRHFAMTSRVVDWGVVG